MTRGAVVRILLLLVVLCGLMAYRLVLFAQLGKEARAKAEAMAARDLKAAGLDTGPLFVKSSIVGEKYFRIEYRKTATGRTNAVELWYQTEDPAAVRLLDVTYGGDATRDPEGALAGALLSSLANAFKAIQLDPAQIKTALGKSS